MDCVRQKRKRSRFYSVVFIIVEIVNSDGREREGPTAPDWTLRDGMAQSKGRI